jgi:hypothetical protein
MLSLISIFCEPWLEKKVGQAVGKGKLADFLGSGNTRCAIFGVALLKR